MSLKFRVLSVFGLGLLFSAFGPAYADTIVVPAIVSELNTNSYSNATTDKLIDNSGMTPPVNTGDTLESAEAAVHVYGGVWESWVTDGSSPDYFAANPAPEIIWDVTGGGNTDISAIVLWQYQNDGGGTGRVGNHARTINLQFNSEADGPGTFTGAVTTITMQAIFDGVNSAQSFSLTGLQCRYVRMVVADNYFGQPGIIAGGDRVGLGEVRFASGTITPSVQDKAHDPQPDGGQPVSPNVVLQWKTGEAQDPLDPSKTIPNPEINKHIIYLGQSPDSLDYLGEVDAGQPVLDSAQYGPLALSHNTTYFWRVDEYINDRRTITGDVWSFTTNQSATARCSGFFLGDLNLDCSVTVSDLELMAGNWLSPCAENGCGDLDESGEVDGDDFSILAGQWRDGVSVVINEFMASNDSGVIVDADGTSSDWIELRNYGADPVNLDGWFLTDDPHNLSRWRIPAITLDPGEYRIIFASGKDRSDPAGELHTNFVLNISGEYLALVRPDGRTIEQQYSDLPIQYEDVSYGLAIRPNESLLTGNYFLTATPGQANGTPYANLGPVILDVTRSPERPDSGQDLVVSAQITRTKMPVASVQLIYRVMYGPETTIPMVDDGTGSDSQADDGIYTATIGAAAYSAGQMVRYAVKTQDIAGGQNRAPLPLDLFGKNQSPEYFGAVVANPNVTSQLPIMEWFTTNQSASHSRTGARASLYYQGRFYDNIYVRQRGQATNGYSQKFDFNKGHDFYVNDKLPSVGEINMNAQGADPAYIRQSLAFNTHEWCGDPASESFMVLMQLNGAFDRVGVLVEQVDEDFLQRHGRDPDGALYKFIQRSGETTSTTDERFYAYLPHTPCFSDSDNGIEKKTRRWEDFSDLQAVVDGLLATTEDERRRFVFDNLNLPEIMDYLAARAIVNDCDDTRKNFYFYRDTFGTGEWEIFPWDNDFTFGVYGDGGPYATHPFFGDEAHLKTGTNQWNVFFDVMFSLPETRQMYLRRLRTMMDKLLQPPDTPVEQRKFEAICDAMAQPVYQHLNISSAVAGVKNYFSRRRTELYETYGPSGVEPLIPEAIDGSALQSVKLDEIEHNPASGIQDEEYIRMTNNASVAVDISGWHLTGGVEFTFAQGTVIPAGKSLYVSPNVSAFRRRSTSPTGNEGRFVVGPYKGHLSNWGETVELDTDDSAPIDTISYAPDPSDAQRYLRITELMYNPGPGGQYDAQEYEYIELLNTGPTTLSLDGVSFVKGLSYSFAGGDAIGPGQYALLVKNQAAFLSRYPGLESRIIGQYTGSLDNGGEDIDLADASNSTIIEFNYSDGWFGVTDGGGFSLTIRDPNGDPNSWDRKSSWRTSTLAGGSPGWDDTGAAIAPGTVVINEVLAHSHSTAPDWIELHNTSNDIVDIGGWFLSDNDANLTKYEIAQGTYIDPCGYIVFYEDTSFGSLTDPGAHTPFAISEYGQTIYLHAGYDGALGGFVDREDFGASPSGIAFGRYEKSDGNFNFVLMSQNTPNQPNAYPRVGPIVITEIMYHPATGIEDQEYIELMNTGPAITIGDTTTAGSWKFTDGIDLDFKGPSVITIDSGEVFLVVKNITAFQQHYTSVPQGTKIFQYDAGSLDNAGEKLEISMPAIMDTPDIPQEYVRVDRVNYSDGSHPDGGDPWPVEADGGGMSLHRLGLDLYGNDVANWKADTPSPGVVTVPLP